MHSQGLFFVYTRRARSGLPPRPRVPGGLGPQDVRPITSAHVLAGAPRPVHAHLTSVPLLNSSARVQGGAKMKMKILMMRHNRQIDAPYSALLLVVLVLLLSSTS